MLSPIFSMLHIEQKHREANVDDPTISPSPTLPFPPFALLPTQRAP
jgi:hypothetical protein